MSYDQRGHKTRLDAPDTHVTTYTYNVLGELLSQTEAKNQTVTFRYDLLGRFIERQELVAPPKLSFFKKLSFSAMAVAPQKLSFLKKLSFFTTLLTLKIFFNFSLTGLEHQSNGFYNES